MNSSVWAIWAAQGSNEGETNEYSRATFEGGFFSSFHGQKSILFFFNIVVSALKSCIISQLQYFFLNFF
jgi:hypothetical protein